MSEPTSRLGPVTLRTIAVSAMSNNVYLLTHTSTGAQVLKDVAASVAESSVFRFDGSDQMPGAVGSGSFWTGMVDYTSGRTDLDATLQAIDASWPAS